MIPLQNNMLSYKYTIKYVFVKFLFGHKSFTLPICIMMSNKKCSVFSPGT